MIWTCETTVENTGQTCLPQGENSDMFVEFIFTFRLWLFVTQLDEGVNGGAHPPHATTPPGNIYSRPYSGIGIFGVIYTHENHRLQLENNLLEKEKHPEQKNINSIGFHDVSFRGCIWIQKSSEPSDDDEGIKKLLALMSLVSLPNHDGSSIAQQNPPYSVLVFFLQDYFLHLR